MGEEATAAGGLRMRCAAVSRKPSYRAAVPAKLAVFACSLAACLLAGEPGFSGLLSLFSLTYLACQRKWRLALGGAAFVAVLGVLLVLIRFAGLRMVVFSEFYVLMFWNLSPVFLATWDLVTTPPGELSSFLSRIHAPTAVILGVLVVFRFFPTMRSALCSVVESMRNRSIARAAEVVRHPLRTCEYGAVPLLLRCLQVADQLAVSAVARGAEAPGVRGSYSARRFAALDGFWVVAWAVAVAALLVIAGVR